MINGQSVIGIIPARGGSKRVPGKNLRSYKGKVLIEWAIDSAKGSELLDDWCVSSEDPKILAKAKSLGAKAIERPQWLATDHAMNEGVLVHLLYTWKWADWVVLLQPTSPQRTPEDIDEVIKRAAHNGKGCLTVDEWGKRNGSVYVAKSSWLISSIAFPRELDTQHYIIPNHRSLDIDYESDFKGELQTDPPYRALMEKQNAR